MEADNIPSNTTNPIEITMNIGWFLLIIFLIVGLAIFIAFVCYHAKDKKIEQYKKLAKNQLTKNELKLLANYRKLNDEDKQVIENAAKDLATENANDNFTPLSKE